MMFTTCSTELFNSYWIIKSYIYNSITLLIFTTYCIICADIYQHVSLFLNIWTLKCMICSYLYITHSVRFKLRYYLYLCMCRALVCNITRVARSVVFLIGSHVRYHALHSVHLIITCIKLKYILPVNISHWITLCMFKPVWNYNKRSGGVCRP